jgi:hypothetical protein
MFKFLSVSQLIQTLIFVVIVGFPLRSLSNPLGINIIFEIKGNAIVQKKQWKKPQAAEVGLTLSLDDTLEVKANSSVKIVCSNTKIWIVKTGIYSLSSGCPSGMPVIRLPGIAINNDTLRGDGQTEEVLAKLPYLITPRNSFILTNKPLLRWNAVQWARNYTVKIDSVNWETQTDKTEIIYSGTTPLQRERRYRVIIEADNGVSSKSDDTVGFTILDEANQKTVLEAKKSIEEQSLSPDEKGLVLAHLYRGYELYGDAIEVLEELIKQGSQSFGIYQLLGDIYLETGLPPLAKKSYYKALGLTTRTENLSALADIQTGLGKVYYGLGKDDEAVQWLEKAKASYGELGDSVQVQELGKFINSISGS